MNNNHLENFYHTNNLRKFNIYITAQTFNELELKNLIKNLAFNYSLKQEEANNLRQQLVQTRSQNIAIQRNLREKENIVDNYKEQLKKSEEKNQKKKDKIKNFKRKDQENSQKIQDLNYKGNKLQSDLEEQKGINNNLREEIKKKQEGIKSIQVQFAQTQKQLDEEILKLKKDKEKKEFQTNQLRQENSILKQINQSSQQRSSTNLQSQQPPSRQQDPFQQIMQEQLISQNQIQNQKAEIRNQNQFAVNIPKTIKVEQIDISLIEKEEEVVKNCNQIQKDLLNSESSQSCQRVRERIKQVINIIENYLENVKNLLDKTKDIREKSYLDQQIRAFVYVKNIIQKWENDVIPSMMEQFEKQENSKVKIIEQMIQNQEKCYQTFQTIVDELFARLQTNNQNLNIIIVRLQQSLHHVQNLDFQEDIIIDTLTQVQKNYQFLIETVNSTKNEIENLFNSNREKFLTNQYLKSNSGFRIKTK